MKLDKRMKMFVGGLVVVLLLVGAWLMTRKGITQNGSSNISPTEVVIPTIDSSVKVSLTLTPAGHEVELLIKAIPSGTNSIDYELSYQTKDQGLQGVIGTINIAGDSKFDKKITLGTCSSGKCVYHEVVGSIKLTLKFTGSYGEKIFEKDYSI